MTMRSNNPASKRISVKWILQSRPIRTPPNHASIVSSLLAGCFLIASPLLLHSHCLSSFLIVSSTLPHRFLTASSLLPRCSLIASWLLPRRVLLPRCFRIASSLRRVTTLEFVLLGMALHPNGNSKRMENNAHHRCLVTPYTAHIRDQAYTGTCGLCKRKRPLLIHREAVTRCASKLCERGRCCGDCRCLIIRGHCGRLLWRGGHQQCDHSRTGGPWGGMSRTRAVSRTGDPGLVRVARRLSLLAARSFARLISSSLESL